MGYTMTFGKYKGEDIKDVVAAEQELEDRDDQGRPWWDRY